MRIGPEGRTAYVYWKKAETPEEWALQMDVQAYLQKMGVGITDNVALGDFSVILGGDGTVLAAGRGCAPNPLLVVNTGHLGFLTSADKENYQEAIKRFLEGSYTLARRSTLRVQVTPLPPATESTVFNAVNEVVIAKNQLSKLVRVNVYVYQLGEGGLVENRELLSEYRADGLIVSTPTGSTAYNLSAGGPILHPGCDNLILSPICPQGLTQRPFVLPNNMRIQIEPLDNDLFVSVDGQDGCPIRGIVDVCYSSHYLYTVNPIETYFQVLRKKLAWGVKPV